MRPFIALLLALIFTVTVNADVKPSRNRFERKLAAATFALYGESGNSRRFFCTTTAFEKTKDGYNLLTAGHCAVDEDFPADLKYYVSENVVDVTGTEIPAALLPVQLLKAWPEDKLGVDFAVFHLVSKNKYPIIRLGDESKVSVGDTIVDVNFSKGLAKQTSEGLISSAIMQTAGASARCHVCKGDFFVQIYAGPGSSGSAVVSKRTHRILGVLVGGFDDPIGATISPISKFKEVRSKP